MTEFSAQHYVDWSVEDLTAEAQKLNVNVEGKNKRQMIDIVYNGELRRRGEELARQEEAQRQAEQQQSAKVAKKQTQTQQDVLNPTPDLDYVTDDAPDFDMMTKAELKRYAAEHNIDLGDATNNDDIRAAIRASEGK